MMSLIKSENTNQMIPYNTYNRSVFEFDWNGVVKDTIINGVGFIPEIGPYLSFIISLFWRDTQVNIWSSIVERLKEYVEERIVTAIRGILLGEMAQLQGKIASVEAAFTDHPGSVEARDLYMSVNVILDSVHLQFTTFERKHNYQILPLYSTTILLQLMYWTMGIERRKEIGLNDNQVNEIQHNIDTLTKHAEEYISDLYSVELETQFNISTPRNIATNVMNVHYHCGIHGMEYLEIVRNVHKNGTIGKSFYPKTLCYSTLFGYNTSQARIMALKDESERVQPIKPNMINGRYNQIKSITGYDVRIGNTPRVGGIEITFENGDTYHQGSRSGESKTIELNGRVIKSIETWGTDALDELMFTLDDGTLFKVGQRYSQNYHKFYADAHYIAGIFLSSDRRELVGQAANICIMFHRITS
ncbi:insecticidal delta-endotoxin Cry8Ea1 family protein [Serratia proteamaculans]|uniref:Pesticidal crystal protein domain-containing protein n=1 Tax=Serratia proteamaculans TaxID=28151 RepID=A0A5Q2VB13_SERPR|nr:insecticidal delta-endotoxin Cry8Ea1 family protein [Serratia proteamaculans]QGH60543.1 hypothetical protein GHV41_06675 [Serratia proteamaculans]